MAEKVFIARQELTPEQKKQVQHDGVKLTLNKGIPQLRGICIALCMENMRLVMEINAHRAALGLEPLPSFEVK